MSQALIRHLRLFCASPNVPPVRQQDGVLAVAGVLERAGLARLLLVDMERWGRNPGASVTNAVDQLAPVAHRYLIGGFGIAQPAGHVGAQARAVALHDLGEGLAVARDDPGYELVHGGSADYMQRCRQVLTPKSPATGRTRASSSWNTAWLAAAAAA